MTDTSETDERRRQARQAGERLRRMRLEREFSLRDVSQATGVSVSQLSRIELGRIIPNVFQAVTLAQFYGTVAALVWGAAFTTEQLATLEQVIAGDDGGDGGALVCG